MAGNQLDTVIQYVYKLAGASACADLADAELLRRFTAHADEGAFTALLQRHTPLVLGVCRRTVSNPQDAEDAFQATFLVLARKAGTVRGSLVGWLHRVAYHAALRVRAAAARQRRSEKEAATMTSAKDHPEVGAEELRAIFDEELQRLPEKYRLPLILCYLEDKTHTEAARQLGWPVGTVKGRLARGRDLLHARLTKRGLGISSGALLAATATETTAASAQLLAATAKAASLFAAGKVVKTGLVAARVIAIAEGMLKATVAAKLKVVAVLAIALAAVGTGAGVIARQGRDEAAQAVAGQPPARTEPDDKAGDRAKTQQTLVRLDHHGERLPDGAIARLGTRRFRAPDEVEALAFSRSGKTVAVSSFAGIFLFEADSGKRIRRLAPAQWQVEKLLAFSPDEKRLAVKGLAVAGDANPSGSKPLKTVVRVWDLDGVLKSHDYDAEHAVWIGWSPSGEPLAVCLEQGGLRLRELAAGRSRRLECNDLHQAELSDFLVCACTPAGQVVAVADNRGIVHVWETKTGRERCTIRPPRDNAASLALSADGRTLASLSFDRPTMTRQNLELWDAVTGKPLKSMAADPAYLNAVTTLTFGPDGKTLATANWNGVRCWDVATGQERSRTHGEGSAAERIAFSGSGQTLATLERNSGAWHLWDVATGKRKPEPVGHRCRPHGTAYFPDGRRLATGGGLDGTIHIWDLATGESLRCIYRRGQCVRGIACSPDGQTLFSTWTDENLWVCDATTGEQQHVIKLEDPDRPDTKQSAESMYLSTDGKTLVALSSYYWKRNDGRPRRDETLVTGWDASARKQVFRRRIPGQTPWIAVSADCRVLVVPHPERDKSIGDTIYGRGPMRVEDLATGEPLMTFPVLEVQTWPLAFSPDGRLLASNNSNPKQEKVGDPTRTGMTLVLWEVATATDVLRLPADGQQRAAFSRDGRLLAMTAPFQEILVWDLAGGRPLRRFKGLGAEVTYLAFSPDSRRLISGLADSTLLIWDIGPRATPIGRKLGAESVAKAWTDLAGTDGPNAFRARCNLASSPEEVMPLLKEKLRPAQAADGQRLRQLLADLNSDSFAVREQTQKELAELAELAVPALRRALAEKPSLEVRRRIDSLLDNLRKPITRPETMRTVRAVAVLEDMATPESRTLLEALAKGAAEARLTQEAKAALVRLDVRNSHP